MRYPLSFLLLITFFCTGARAQTLSPELRRQVLAEREDSTTWDLEMLAEDRQIVPYLDMIKPLTGGAFPVPEYDRLGAGSFRGLYSIGDRYTGQMVNGKRVVYENYGATASPVNRAWTGDSIDRVFFTIITVTDTVDTEEYSTSFSYVGSRNHPDVVAEGFIASKHNRLDYVAFKTAEGGGYAIVNMRLFNLSDGDVIVVAPQKDGSLRSRQLKVPARTKAAALVFITQDILKRQDIVRFLTGPGVI